VDQREPLHGHRRDLHGIDHARHALTVDWSQANSIYAEQDCLVSEQGAPLAKGFDPALTGLDYEMPCSIERTDGYCPGNAWYDYNGINFCAQSTSYGNTGRMSDVLYHEYGQPHPPDLQLDLAPRPACTRGTRTSARSC
jgi:hypothetical protein